MKYLNYKALATLIVTSGLALAVQPAFAQTDTGSTGGTTGATSGGTAPGGGAEPTNIPGHPRVNQVDQRDNNQQQRIDKGEADGQLSKGQAARDQEHLDHQEAVQKNQEAHDGGHLTKSEQHHDNKSMNRSSRKIHRQRHGGARRHHK